MDRSNPPSDAFVVAVEKVVAGGEPFAIHKGGKPVAVVVRYDEWLELQHASGRPTEGGPGGNHA